MSFVLDNSIVCGWIIRSQSTALSAAIMRRLRFERAAAPPLLVLEYTNVLRTACKRGGLTASSAQAAIEQLNHLPIEFDAEPPDAALILSIALRHDLSSYDASYLELALRLQRPIATQDLKLAAAARVAGVGALSA